MVLKRKITIIFIVIAVLLGFATYKFIDSKNAKFDGNPISKTGFLLGTIVEVKVYEKIDDETLEQAFNILDEIENKMSVNIETSEVSQINRNAGINSVKVSEDTFHVIDKGKYYSDISNGNFDISIGPLVELWGIGTDEAQIPSQSQLDETLDKIDYNKVILDSKDNSVKLAEEGMMIDLGGIAKGFAADKIAEFLKSQGINSAIINLGGNVNALGESPNSGWWRIGIQDPIEARGNHLGILKVKDKSVVSSGVYERYFIQDEKRYHHILSPFTGYPVENSLLSVSIISDKSIDGDGLSTAVFALGLEEGYKLVSSLDGIEAIFIDSYKNIYITPGLKDNFEITNNQYSLQTLQ